MKRVITSGLAGLFLVIVATAITQAQVKQVRMKIAGYLCGF